MESLLSLYKYEVNGANAFNGSISCEDVGSVGTEDVVGGGDSGIDGGGNGLTVWCVVPDVSLDDLCMMVSKAATTIAIHNRIMVIFILM